MTSGPEWEKVERPLLEHLFSLGWETLSWSERQPDGVDARSSDRDVLLERRLGLALEKINRGPDGAPWLDEARVSAAVAELRSMSAGVDSTATRLLPSMKAWLRASPNSSEAALASMLG